MREGGLHCVNVEIQMGTIWCLILLCPVSHMLNGKISNSSWKCRLKPSAKGFSGKHRWARYFKETTNHFILLVGSYCLDSVFYLYFGHWLCYWLISEIHVGIFLLHGIYHSNNSYSDNMVHMHTQTYGGEGETKRDRDRDETGKQTDRQRNIQRGKLCIYSQALVGQISKQSHKFICQGFG